ncbi:MAG: phosphatase PAP2 family protein [Clostridia bacterium]|nr:phosphatase PAP2 family protein [Clostridia bacterium]
MNAWELTILHWLREHLQCSVLDTVMPLISALADGGIMWILLAVGLLCFARTRRAGLSMGIALLLGVIIGNLVLKNLVGRVRPYDVDPSVMLLVDRLTDFAFPSGHTLASFGAATALTVRYRRAGAAALVLAGLIAFSRLYLFVHYPTDVLAGALLGVGFGFLGCYFTDALWKKFELCKKIKK